MEFNEKRNPENIGDLLTPDTDEITIKEEIKQEAGYIEYTESVVILHKNDEYIIKEENDCSLLPDERMEYDLEQQSRKNEKLEPVFGQDTTDHICCVCNFKSKSSRIYLQHVQSNHGKVYGAIVYTCEMCSLQCFYRVEDIKEHFNTHHQSKCKYNCVFCVEFLTEHLQEYQLHYLNFHANWKERDRPTQSRELIQTTGNEKNQPFPNKQSGDGNKCCFCNYKDLKNSLIQCNSGQKEISNFKMFQCKSCAQSGSENAKERSLLDHENSIKCFICSFRADSMLDYRFHFIFHHTRNLESCTLQTGKSLSSDVDKEANCSTQDESLSFTCECNCMYSCKYLDEVQFHMLICHKQGLICPFCKSVTFSKKTLVDHVYRCHKKKHDTIQIGCEYCPRKVNDLKELRNHMTSCRAYLLSCYTCNSEPDLNDLIQEYVCTFHRNILGLVTYRCGFCFSIFDAVSDIQQHFTSKHSRHVGRFQCAFANCSFKSNNYLLYEFHYIFDHEKYEKTCNENVIFKCSDEKEIFKCSVCEYQMETDRDAIIKHLSAYHRREYYEFLNYECGHCLKISKTVLDIEQHFATKHFRAALYKCPFEKCPFKTPNRVDYECHYNIEHKNLIVETNLIDETAINDVTLKCGNDLVSSELIARCNFNDPVEPEKIIEHAISSHRESFHLFYSRCGHCLTIFGSISDVEQHFSNSHAGCTKLFRCWLLTCPFQTKHRVDYQFHHVYEHKKHLLQNAEDSDLIVKKLLHKKTCTKCLFCDYTNVGEDRGEDAIVRHVYWSHRKYYDIIKYQCGYCLMDFSTVSDVQQHFFSAHPDLSKNFKCPILKCPFETEHKIKYQFHYINCEHEENKKNNLIKSVERKELLKCVYCGFENTSEDKFFRHVYTSHREYYDVIKYQCGYCLIDFCTVSDVEQHFSSAHPDSNKDFKCPVLNCPFKSEHMIKYQFHYINCEHKANILRNTRMDFQNLIKSVERKEFEDFDDLNKELETNKLLNCVLCGDEKISEDEIVQHVYDSHPKYYNIIKYQCGYCLQGFRSPLYADQHFGTLHPGQRKQFRCPRLKCLFETDHLRKFQFHYISEHKEYSLRNTRTDMETLRKSAKRKKLVRCVFCDYGKACEEAIVTHVYNSHRDYYDIIKYQCGHCLMGFLTLLSAEEHFYSTHPGLRKDFKCPLLKCSFKTEHMVKYQFHYISCERVEDVVLKNTPDDSDTLKQPLETNTLIKCVFCDHEKVDEDQLVEHVYSSHRDYHDVIKYQCGHCLRAFLTISDAEQHFPSAHPDRRREFKCPLLRCVFKTEDLIKYRVHYMREHKDHVLKNALKCSANPVKPLERRKFLNCVFCGDEDVGEDAIVEHVYNTHRQYYDVIKYQCGHCLKDFSTVADVQQHFSNEHPGQKKDFKCPLLKCVFKTEHIRKYQFHYICCKNRDDNLKKTSEDSDNRNESIEIKQILKCLFCDWETFSEDAFVDHIYHVHRRSYYALQYQCGHCLLKFRTVTHIERHCSREHSGCENNYTCPFWKCDFKTEHIIKYQFHHIFKHRRKTRTQPTTRPNPTQQHTTDYSAEFETFIHNNSKGENSTVAQIPKSYSFKILSCCFCNHKEKAGIIALINHVYSVHRRFYDFLNDQCKNQFNANLKSFTCPVDQCLFNSSYMIGFQYHLVSEHKKYMLTCIKNDFNCEYCLYQPTKQMILKNHSIYCHKQLISCYFCDHQVVGKESILEHLLKHEQFYQLINYQCFYCLDVLSCPKDAKTHFISKHRKDHELYTCSSIKCTFSTKSVSDYQFHFYVHKKSFLKNLTLQTNLPSACDFCLLRLNHSELELHMKWCEKRLTKCCFCEYEVVGKKPITEHLLSHKQFHDSIYYQCYYCMDIFCKAQNIRQHFVSDHPNLGEFFKCPSLKCTFTTQSMSDYQFYYAYAHGRNLEFGRCSYCTFESKDSSVLRSHVLNCTTVNLLSCCLCEYKCNSENVFMDHYFSAHKKFYSLITYICQYCLATFGNVVLIRNHFNYAHSNLPECYKCLHCYKYKSEHLEYYQVHFVNNHISHSKETDNLSVSDDSTCKSSSSESKRIKLESSNPIS